MGNSFATVDWPQLAEQIKQWGVELGFASVGISDLDLSHEAPRLRAWLAEGYHGEMAYMEQNEALRCHPEQLHPNALRAITVTLNYFPANSEVSQTLNNPYLGYISRYALGRDYHKVMRARLKKLAQRIAEVVPEVNARPFVDSAPILEGALAARAGLGWVGKNSLLLNQQQGSLFFIGELLLDLPLPVEPQVTEPKEWCGRCQSCLDLCPTGAIVRPHVVDARRCISYLTIEYAGSIPLELRPLIGNRIYGCDNCQLSCPWNRQLQPTTEADFSPNPKLIQPKLLELWQWDEATFLKTFEGSPIRRIGFECWRRNLSVALGNAPQSTEIRAALIEALPSASPLVAEHIEWAIGEQLHQREDNRQQQRLIRMVERGIETVLRVKN